MTKVNKVINEIMKNQGLSLTEIASIIGVSESYLSSVNTNKFKPRDEVKRKLYILHSLPSCRVKDLKKNRMLNKERCVVDVLSALPEFSSSGFELYAKRKDDHLLVWYRPKNTGKITSLLPKYIPLTKEFIRALGLSVGDGSTHVSKENVHYTFGNTNLDLVRRVVDWLGGFKKPKEKLSFFVIYRSSYSDFIDSASEIFSIPNDEINVYHSDRHEKAVLTIQLSDSIFIALHNNLFKKLRSFILNQKRFRRAFLTGLFAAEGHVKHSKYGTIESISFAYNPNIEEDLAKFVIECLKKENIDAKDDGDGEVYFCKYSQMLRAYNLGIFSLHKEKELKFIDLCGNATFSLYLGNGILRRLRKFSQIELARVLDASQSAISKWLNDNSGIRIDYFVKLFPFLEIRKNELINKIKFIRVSNSKISNKQSIEFLLSLHKIGEGNGKIKIGKPFNGLSIEALLFVYLYHIKNLSSTDTTSKSLSKTIGKVRVTIQQRLLKLRKEGLVKRKKIPRYTFIHKLTEKGKETLQRLSKKYELITSIRGNI